MPLEFGDKEKFIKRLSGDPLLDKKIQITLPRMSYQLIGANYDSNRKLNTNNKNFAISPDNDKAFLQYNPVPYDFTFSLTIYTRNIEDGNQILEQIVPYFTPDYTLRINLVPEMGITKNIPIVLDSIKPSIDSDGFFNTETRTVFWTLTFTVKSFIFGGIKEVPIIKSANVNHISSNFAQTSEKSSCKADIIKPFLVYPNGYGNYIENEYVYQGINFDNAYATGRVKEWSNTANTIIIKDVEGNFKLNQPLTGETSLSIHILRSVYPNTYIDITNTYTPYPNTATANSYWTVNESSIP